MINHRLTPPPRNYNPTCLETGKSGPNPVPMVRYIPDNNKSIEYMLGRKQHASPIS